MKLTKWKTFATGQYLVSLQLGIILERQAHFRYLLTKQTEENLNLDLFDRIWTVFNERGLRVDASNILEDDLT